MSDSEIKLFYAQSSEVKNRILAPDEHLRSIDTGAYYVAGPDGKPQAVLTATTSAQGVEKLVQIGPNIERERGQQDIELMRQDANFRRMGRVGMGNKAVIALRFDDWQNAFKTSVRSLMTARSLPYSLVTVSRWQTAHPWGSDVTPAELQQYVSEGAEVFVHGFDHDDYVGYDGLYGNVVTARQELEELLPMVKIQGFSLPGVTPIYTADQRGSAYPYDQLSNPDQWYGPAGRLLMRHYPIVESDSGPRMLHIGANPNLYFYGRAHESVDALTLDAAKDTIDKIVREKKSVRVMTHAGTLGLPGKMTVAEFGQWLDYIVQKRNEGVLEVVMPSSLPYVTNSSTRLDLMNGEGKLIGVANTPNEGWYRLGAPYQNFYPSGGPDDLPYYETGIENAQPSYVVTGCTQQGYNGESFMFEGMARAKTAGSTGSARVQMSAAGTSWSLGKTFVVGDAWTKIRFPFTLPKVGPNGEYITTIWFSPQRYGGDNIYWADMSVLKL